MKAAVILPMLLAAIAFPLVFADPYYQRIGVMTLIFGLLATSLGILVGRLRIISAGHSAFFGIGAYTSALLSVKAGTPFLAALASAALLSAVIGLAVSVPLLKLKGHFFAMGTMAFGIIVQMLLLNWESLTNGPNGVPGIPLPALPGYVLATDRSMYYFSLALLALTLWLLQRLYRSPIGRALVSIREDEIVAATLGIRVLRYKALAFTLSAGLAGLAGSLFAHYMAFINFNSFSPAESFMLLAMVITGGMNHLLGPLLGAALFTVLPEWLRGMQDYRFLLYGLILTVVLLLRPGGLLGDGGVRPRGEIRRRRRMKTHARTTAAGSQGTE
ncbi:branched-chain amino acid ABC transporter permease [Paenibacillus puerhi]|uniref:branched-chain amino acid ABC transporter permease n=1 Tax=Paenibacillus puerhi TaxID=2692622 RepID=UPI0013574A37|nr:branched-chain amino acid ABC transporter permease [Paenibacillus puerhi]